MEKANKTKIWLAQTRANFLILAVFLVSIGLAYAAKYQTGGTFNWLHAVLIIIGTVSAHASVNLFNEFSDFQTKIDFNTHRTPFSGGSGMLVEGNTNPKSVLMASIGTLLLAAAIGVYFAIVSHWVIGAISLVGAFAIVFYTKLLAKLLLGELFSGLTLGSLVVVGAFVAMNGIQETSFANLVPQEVWLMSVPPGILTALLLFLNEFPDADADKKGGRNHLVIKLGKQKAAWVYVFAMAATFDIIILLPIFGISSFWVYLALLPLPLAIKASITAVKYPDNFEKLVPAMGINVMVVLLTDLLIAVAVFIQLF